jgi:hypothetical protein
MRPDIGPASRAEPVRLLSLVIADAGRIVLLIAGADRWREESGYTFVPLELPGGPAEPAEPDERALQRIATARFGGPVRLLPGAWRYGPSQSHAIDRRPATDAGEPCPLLEITRALPEEQDDLPPRLVPVVVRAYRGSLVGAGPLDTVSALWLAPDALRAAVRGLPLADLLARPDVLWRPASGDVHPPDDALIYVPSEYGERYLLRAVGKYGQHAVIPEEPTHEPG